MAAPPELRGVDGGSIDQSRQESERGARRRRQVRERLDAARRDGWNVGRAATGDGHGPEESWGSRTEQPSEVAEHSALGACPERGVGGVHYRVGYGMSGWRCGADGRTRPGSDQSAGSRQ